MSAAATALVNLNAWFLLQLFNLNDYCRTVFSFSHQKGVHLNRTTLSRSYVKRLSLLFLAESRCVSFLQYKSDLCSVFVDMYSFCWMSYSLSHSLIYNTQNEVHGTFILTSWSTELGKLTTA